MAVTSEYIVRTKDLEKIYTMGGTELKALNGVSLDIRRGEYLSLMGPSGSGKSTLFNAIGGLDKPDSGSVFINEVDIAQLDAAELAYLRCRQIGYIFQTFNLIPVMTALENVMLDSVGLGDRYHHKPTELSGGQQQRVAVARALANDPSIILADEPTGNLDQKTGTEIIDLLRVMNKEHNVTIISATHDPKMVSVSDRVVHIRDGKVERIQNRDELDIVIGGIAEHH